LSNQSQSQSRNIPVTVEEHFGSLFAEDVAQFLDRFQTIFIDGYSSPLEKAARGQDAIPLRSQAATSRFSTFRLNGY
jgi:hypothetical protein